MESRVIMNEVRSSADLAIVNECWLRRWTPSRAARAILSFQPVLERIQYLYFIIFWKKEWKLNRNIGSSKLNSPLSFFLFSLLYSFPFTFSFSLFFFCIIAPPAPKNCLLQICSSRKVPTLDAPTRTVSHDGEGVKFAAYKQNVSCLFSGSE